MAVQRGDHVEVSTEEARQGETSGHVRTVLGISLALAIITGAIFLYYFAV